MAVAMEDSNIPGWPETNATKFQFLTYAFLMVEIDPKFKGMFFRPFQTICENLTKITQLLCQMCVYVCAGVHVVLNNSFCIFLEQLSDD